jgi:hypothetical protein
VILCLNVKRVSRTILFKVKNASGKFLDFSIQIRANKSLSNYILGCLTTFLLLSSYLNFLNFLISNLSLTLLRELLRLSEIDATLKKLENHFLIRINNKILENVDIKKFKNLRCESKKVIVKHTTHYL